MSRLLAISDIHGCAQTFQALLDQLDFSRSDTLFLLGDYINRGPDSRGVIDIILHLQHTGYDVRCLRGNHEQMLLNSIQAAGRGAAIRLETRELLDSFGVARAADIPRIYLDWLHELPLYFNIPGFFMVHAGLNFHRPDPLSDPDAMLWIRQWHHTLERDWLGDRLLIHGHTPQPDFQIREDLNGLDTLPILCIDCGCAFGQLPYGQLCAVDLNNRALFFQEKTD
ncbi:MAG: metallophosphoesterase family protein [Saprospiraceae bacterium]|nr:metallophosphoesterase family protein [Saprospiraceae bacterium]HNL37499.1 metallophosphoesterase family protein [Saprospiraceae bacterium]